MKIFLLALIAVSCLAGVGAAYVSYFIGDPKVYTLLYGAFALIGPLAFLINLLARKKGGGFPPSDLWLVFCPLGLVFVNLETAYRASILLIIALAIMGTILRPVIRKTDA